MASFSGSTCRNLAMMRSEIYHALSNINYPLRHCASFRWFPVANRRDPTISSPERQLNSIWSLGVVSLQKVIYDSLLALVKNPQSSNSMGWEEWGERKKPCCYQICFKFERISKMINNSTKPYINTSIHQYSSCENETCVKRVWNVCENVWVISLCVLWHCELVESSSHRLVEPRLHLFSSDLETSTAPSSRENPGSSWDLRPASRLTGWQADCGMQNTSKVSQVCLKDTNFEFTNISLTYVTSFDTSALPHVVILSCNDIWHLMILLPHDPSETRAKSPQSLLYFFDGIRQMPHLSWQKHQPDLICFSFFLNVLKKLWLVALSMMATMSPFLGNRRSDDKRTPEMCSQVTTRLHATSA